MSIYRVIDKLEASVKDGAWLPFGYRVVAQDRTLDLIEKLRASLPEEVGRAKQVTQEKDRLLSDARAQASQLLDESEVARQAQARADQLIADAQARAAEIRRGADEYADNVLAQLDTTLGGALASVQKGRQALAGGRTAANVNGVRGR